MHFWTLEGVQAEIERLTQKKKTGIAETIADFVTCANMVAFNVVSIEYDSKRDVITLNKAVDLSVELIQDQRRTWPRFFEELRRQSV